MTPSLARTIHVEQDKGHTVQTPAELRPYHAYILLGDAGMGKSTLFRAEYEAMGEAAIYESVQDFLDLYDNRSPDEFIGKTLFLDGLDEARSRGEQSVTSDLRKLLIKLNRPRFRLSCRAAEWFGQTDQQAFAKLLPSGEQLFIAHLQPFSRNDVIQHLRNHTLEAETFIQQAETVGLNELLHNPQTLNMLIAAVDGEQGWPHSKREVFELACRKLAEEHNEIHQLKGQSPVDSLLEAAGYWYATMLLSGRHHASLNLPDSDERVSLNSSPGFANKALPLESVLRSRLFQGDGKDEYFYPHRSVAEYLAARYINQRLSAGLPLLRIWSLLCGVDGGVIGNLRGVYGWLASLVNSAHHREVIEKDPIALLVYGDAEHFSRGSKTLLIEALQQHIRQHPSFRSSGDPSQWINQAMGALATSDMEDIFRGYFEQLDETEDKQQLAGCLLNAIEYGNNMPALQQVLVGIVHNDSNWGGVRRYAMQALLAHAANVDVCLSLLEAFRGGEASDPDREMIGSILAAYYPHQVAPDRVLQYFLPERNSNLIGFYRHFWSDTLAARTPPECLPALISQAMQIDLSDHHDWHGRYEFDDMLGKLLAHTLAIQGETLPIATLGQWLLTGLKYSQRQSCEAAINTWARQYPARYQELLIHVLRTAPPDNPLRNFWSIWHRINRPEWFWLWVIISVSNAELADIRTPLFELAKWGLNDKTPYDLDELYRLTQTYSELAGQLDDLVCNLTGEDWRIEDARYARKRKAKENEQRKKNQQAIYAVRGPLADATVALHALDWLARQYWRAFPTSLNKEQTLTPFESICTALDNDEELAQLAMQALGNALQRNDLPSLDELITLQQDNRRPLCFWACMAAAREHHGFSEQHFLALQDDKLSLLAAMVLIGLHVPDLAWHKALLAARPDIVSTVYQHYLSHMLPTSHHINGPGYLLKDERYADVARQLLPGLFQTMPEQLSAQGWDAVRMLWLAGIKLTDTATQRGWLDRQLANPIHKRTNKAALLAMALALDPAAYQQEVSHFSGSPARIRLLARALVTFEEGRRLEQWSESLLDTQIEHLAAIYPPPVFETDIIPLEADIGSMIDGMIRVLSSKTSDSASLLIRRLLACPALQQWRWHLRVALSEHQMHRRRALFRTPPPAQVVATLKDAAPNGIADLQAIVVHELQQLAKQARDGSEGMYRQFWSEDKYGHVTEPKIENSGRDVLLAILKERFARLELSLIEERAYADSKRADISIEYARLGIRLPVEIKRSSHDELWTAVSEQLVKRYTRDPGSLGYGIYLVLWFGSDRVKPPPRPLPKPTSASELAQMFTDQLSEAERPLIKVCVIDVEKPAK